MKTKIVVFRKRGRIFINKKWTCNGQTIEVVDHFNYLGTVFIYTGNFMKCKCVFNLIAANKNKIKVTLETDK
jgi:hypothetical protein